MRAQPDYATNGRAARFRNDHHFSFAPKRLALAVSYGVGLLADSPPECEQPVRSCARFALQYDPDTTQVFREMHL